MELTRESKGFFWRSLLNSVSGGVSSIQISISFIYLSFPRVLKNGLPNHKKRPSQTDNKRVVVSISERGHAGLLRATPHWHGYCLTQSTPFKVNTTKKTRERARPSAITLRETRSTVTEINKAHRNRNWWRNELCNKEGNWSTDLSRSIDALSSGKWAHH